MTIAAPATIRETVRVGLGERAYDVVIGPDLFADLGPLLDPVMKRDRTVIVTDDQVAPHHLGALEAALDTAGISHQAIVLPAGEGTKNFTQLGALCGQLLDAKVERNDRIIALGGGVIGDLVGFAAAILRRGVGFIQIPTSLLAQVDSSVGGKTAVNVPQGKNLIGAFHQPVLVLADTNILDTLPQRQLEAGYAEIVKYGLLGDYSFFEWLEHNGAKVLAGDLTARLHAIKTSVAMKAEIVAEDETEQGRRALLNLGHTFGHALEAETGYSATLLHGEGVAIGMALAFSLSAKMGLVTGQDAGRVKAHLKAAGLKSSLMDIDGAPLDVDSLLDHMKQDKKVVDDKLTFILARAIGDAFITQDVALNLVRDTLNDDQPKDGN